MSAMQRCAPSAIWGARNGRVAVKLWRAGWNAAAEKIKKVADPEQYRRMK